MTPDYVSEVVLRATSAESIRNVEPVQSLWSGYGQIIRFLIRGGDVPSVIVKQIAPPAVAAQPRGWNTDVSHQRKLRSYEVEAAWYQNWARRTDNNSRVPKCLAMQNHGSERLMVLEDLDAAGFAVRNATLDLDQAADGIRWLANFHSRFLGTDPAGLWPIGCYWHLETRPDELAAMPADNPLKRHAAAFDRTLNNACFQTLVHGDAKVANFCFASSSTAPNRQRIAAVDFQYVGGGCGIKDVAYFLGSCMTETQCESHDDDLLRVYFETLRDALKRSGMDIDPDALETEWRQLYPVAWADFNRFLVGWCPGHRKLHSYSAKMTELAIQVIA